MIILVLNWLTEEGYLYNPTSFSFDFLKQINLLNSSYIESARSLERETNLDMRKYDVCDNIDLETILQEFESYYYVKFSRYPKITKKLNNASNNDFFIIFSEVEQNKLHIVINLQRYKLKNRQSQVIKH